MFSAVRGWFSLWNLILYAAFFMLGRRKTHSYFDCCQWETALQVKSCNSVLCWAQWLLKSWNHLECGQSWSRLTCLLGLCVNQQGRWPSAVPGAQGLLCTAPWWKKYATFPPQFMGGKKAQKHKGAAEAGYLASVKVKARVPEVRLY